MKLNLYVISTKYQPLVKIKEHAISGKKTVKKKSVSTHDLRAIFNASKADVLIACDKKYDALAVMAMLVKEHDMAPDFIEKNVKILGTPIVYTVEVDSEELPEQTILTADDLVNYADTTSIPQCTFKNNDKSLIDEQLKKHSKEITIRKMNGALLGAVTNACYLNSFGKSSGNVNLETHTNFLSSCGQGCAEGAAMGCGVGCGVEMAKRIFNAIFCWD